MSKLNGLLGVLIPHYNHPEGLKKSILSIKEDFSIDIIVIDDGSHTRFNEEEIQTIYKKGKVHFEYLQENQGIGRALNRGLEVILEKGYRFVGRLDCGDINHPNKFKLQLDYLLANPEIKLLGTWANVVDQKGVLIHYLKHPQKYNHIRKKMYFNNMFIHPSVVFESSLIDKVGMYPEKYSKAAQDYAFFFNVIEKYKSENLPEILIDYVVEPHSISTTKRRLQVKNRIKVVMEHFYFGFYPIVGLIRGVILYIFPRSATTFVKKVISKNK